MNHEFLNTFLEQLQNLPAMLTFIKALYQLNKCVLVIGGRRLPLCSISRGIRQGCLLSPPIFAIAADLLLWRVSRLWPHILLRSYVNMLAMLLPDGLSETPFLHSLLGDYVLPSGLELNLRQTVWVPLHEGDPAGVTSSVIAKVPQWCSLQYEATAK